MIKLSLFASTIAAASAFVLPLPFGGPDQKPIGGEYAAASRFNCDLPPVLDPSSDGLPSAESLFSGQDALEKQVKRHQAIVQVPSICYDDLGDFDSDKRWASFYDLHHALETTYPKM